MSTLDWFQDVGNVEKQGRTSLQAIAFYVGSSCKLHAAHAARVGGVYNRNTLAPRTLHTRKDTPYTQKAPCSSRKRRFRNYHRISFFKSRKIPSVRDVVVPRHGTCLGSTSSQGNLRWGGRCSKPANDTNMHACFSQGFRGAASSDFLT